MSNRDTINTNNNAISSHNTRLTNIINTINNLPAAGGGSENLTAELTSQDTLLTTQTTTVDDIKNALVGKVGGVVKLQDKTIEPSTEKQTITADEGYSGLRRVTANPMKLSSCYISAKAGIAVTQYPSSSYHGFSFVRVNPVFSDIDPNIQPENIKKGVEILDTTGTYEGVTPTGTIDITTNGTHDVTNYASANVNIQSSGGALNTLMTIPTSLSGSANGYVSFQGTTYDCINPDILLNKTFYVYVMSYGGVPILTGTGSFTSNYELRINFPSNGVAFAAVIEYLEESLKFCTITVQVAGGTGWYGTTAPASILISDIDLM